MNANDAVQVARHDRETPMVTLLFKSVLASVVMIGAVAQADIRKENDGPAKSIEGVYLLYRIEKFAITARRDKGFSIRGLDQAWSGEGRIDGNEGYYNWIFADGKTGRTTFTINADGTLTGQVRGAGLDWLYLARPSKEKAEKR
jgi:hypothetical protein